MTSFRSQIAWAGTLAATLVTLPAVAQDPARVSAAARIVAVGEQGMLMQSMARDLCFAELGIDPDANLASLAKAREDFRASHAALKNGSSDLGLAPLDIPALSDAWAEVDAKWQSLDEAYTAVEGVSPIERKDFDNVVRRTAQLLKSNDDLMAAIREEAVANTGVIDGASAAGLFHYTRQAMLAEKIAKEACLLLRGDWGDGPRFELQASQTEFDGKLTLFLRGNPLAGVPAPASPEISEKLAAAQADWGPAQPIVLKAAEGNGITVEGLQQISTSLESFLTDMGAAVDLYQAKASGQ